MVQKREDGKDGVEAVGGIVRETRVERWASSGYGGREIDDDDIDNEFQECFPEERFARGRRASWEAVLWLLNPAYHPGAMRDVKHPPELLHEGEIRWRVIRATCIGLRKDPVANAPPVIGEKPFCE